MVIRKKEVSYARISINVHAWEEKTVHVKKIPLVMQFIIIDCYYY